MEKRIQKIITIFFITSFIGWLMETGLLYMLKGHYVKRGAIALPLCVIYGVATTLLFLIAGLPSVRWKQKYEKKFKNKYLIIALSCITYFFIVFIISFIVEYSAGYLIDKFGSKSLWDYKNVWGNINGYVALPILFCFGVVGTFYMYSVYPWLLKKLDHVSQHNLLFINFILIIALFWNYLIKM